MLITFCVSVQSDQHLCHLLSRRYNSSTCNEALLYQVLINRKICGRGKKDVCDGTSSFNSLHVG